MELQNDKSIDKSYNMGNSNDNSVTSVINDSNLKFGDVKVENVNLQDLYTSDLEEGFSSVSKNDLLNVKKANERLNIEVETIDLL